MLRAAGCIVVSVCLFAPLAVYFYPSPPLTPAEQERLAHLFVDPAKCRPEPGERHAFLAGLVFLPACLLACSWICRRLGQGSRARVPTSLLWALDLACAGLVLGLCWYASAGESHVHLRPNVFFRHPLALLPATGLLLAVLRWGTRGRAVLRWGAHLTALVLVVGVFLASVFEETGLNASWWHFTVVFNPVVQVHLGKGLLLDAASQYGLYAHLLQPLFVLLGLSVVKFTVVMGLLTAGSFLALWLFLSRAVRNPLVALLGFGALVFACWAHKTPIPVERFLFFDLYFQYFPIRFVFPAALVLLAWCYFRRPGRLLYWGTTAFLSLGVLWNADAGLPALATWTSTLCFAEFFQAGWRARLLRSACHLAAGGATLALVVALYSAAIRLTYGDWPDFARALHYQRLFYGEGFYMMPLPLPGTWVVVLLVYLAGLAYAVSALLSVSGARDRGSVRVHMVFLLSVLGTGLFAYYQGRSDSQILPLVWWPCWPLLALFLDDLTSLLRAGSSRPLHWLGAGALAALLGGYAGTGGEDLEVWRELIREQFPGARDLPFPELREEAAFLRRSIPAGEGLLILSKREAVLHLLSGVASVARCSMLEMVLLEDYRELCRVLERRPGVKVFIDRELAGKGTLLTPQSGFLIDFLQEGYEVAGATTQGYLLRRIQRKRDCLLTGPEPSLWHLSRADDADPWCLFSRAATLGPAFTVEVLLMPAADEAPFATVMTNHPGRACSGFSIHHKAQGLYEVVLGNGSSWEVGPDFQLEPGRWHYLAVVVEPEAVTVYLDGRRVARRGRAGLPFSDSDLPVYLGNWIGENRPLKGQIREGRIVGRALSAAEITQQYERTTDRLK